VTDDNDLFNWFYDDDWSDNLARVIRESIGDPVRVTIEQIRQFAGELANSLGSSASSRKIEIKSLEATSRSFDLSDLSAASLFSLASIIEHSATRRGKPDSRGLVENMPLGQLMSILRPKASQLRVTDVVGVAKLAARQASHVDVFDRLDMNVVSDYLSRGALRSLTLSELRAALEGLCGSGILRGTKST